MLRHDTLQSHGASLGVHHEVRGEDLRPGEAVVAGEGEGGHHHVLPAGETSLGDPYFARFDANP